MSQASTEAQDRRTKALDCGATVLYTVHMTRVSATEARKRLFKLLDAAERGETVVLERKGVRFRIAVEPMSEAAPREAEDALIEILDPTILSGEWTWEWEPDGALTLVEGDDADAADS